MNVFNDVHCAHRSCPDPLTVTVACPKAKQPHRSNKNATHRARLDNADTGAAFDASGRRAKEDAATEKTTNKGRSNPRRKSENNAAEFPAKAAGSPQGLSTTLPTIIKTLRESKRLVSGVDLLIELAKERQPVHRQSVFVFIALGGYFHQMPGKPFAGAFRLGTVC
jgi:hypothetical protein